MIKTKTHRNLLFTPLRYPGGKTSLFEFFDNVIKKHEWTNINYIEPYAGGAGAALSLLLLEKVNSIVINDYDPAIFSFWEAITQHNRAFIQMIEDTPITIEEWLKQKELYRQCNANRTLELGFATFFLNRTNRSGILNAGPVGGKNQLGSWKLDARFNKQKMIEKIKLIGLYKDRITVSNADGLEIIKKYSKYKNSFFYIDPPYFQKGADLYLNAFKYEDHKNLANLLAKYGEAKWILSYDNADEILNLYPRYNYREFILRYSANHNSKSGSELMFFSNSIDMTIIDEI